MSTEKQHYYPRLKNIPYGRQCIDDEDIQSVLQVLRSPFLTQGPKVGEFEEKLSALTKAHFAVVVNSGTSALHLACLAADIKKGDEVIIPTNTFLASANCVVYCSGTPVFADIDLKTYNISISDLEKKINERTKAVIPVHFAGQSCDMQKIKGVVEAAEKKFGHTITIIEDATHALGSQYKDSPVGSCTYSDMTVFSFHPVKHISTGEGGAVVTNNEALQKNVRCMRSHGMSHDKNQWVYQEQGLENGQMKPWYYEQNDLGFNYRLTDIQCALGISQLKKLDKFHKKRRQIFDIYNECFKEIDLMQIPFESPDNSSNFHLYVSLFDFDKMNISRCELMQKLKEKGIQTQVHYIPVHTQPFYRKNFHTNWGDCPNAEHYYRRCLSLPLHPAMADKDANRVVGEIKQFIQ